MSNQPKRRWLRLQFSLRTLLLVVLFGASSALLWLHWEPWRLERTFTIAKIYPPEITPDGRRVVVLGSDNSLLVRDFESGSEHKVAEHVGEITTFSFSSDSRRVVAGFKDNTLRVFDLNTGVCCCTFNSSEEMTLSPDRQFAAVPADGKIQVFNTSDGSHRYSLAGTKGISFLGNSMIVTTDDAFISRVWIAHDGRLLADIPGHSYGGFLFDMSPDGNQIAAFDGINVQIIDTRSGAATNTLKTASLLQRIEFSPNSKFIITCANIKCSVWEVANGDQRLANRFGASFLPDNRVIVGDPFSVIDLRDGQVQQFENVLPLQTGEKFQFLIYQDRFAVTANGDDAFVWDFLKCIRLCKLKDIAKYCSVSGADAEISSGGHYISFRDKFDGHRWIWSLEHGRGQPLGPHQQKDDGVNIKFSGDERHVVTYWEEGDKITLYKLHRPESHFGYLYLPEFWLTLAFAIALGWNIWRGHARKTCLTT